MTGHIQGVATRFEQAALPGFFRIWSGLHQLDFVLQQFYTELNGQELLWHFIKSQLIFATTVQLDCGDKNLTKTVATPWICPVIFFSPSVVIQIMILCHSGQRLSSIFLACR